MCLYDGLLPRALSIFELPSLRSGQRGIVIGMGGGCDVLGALAFAQAWEARSPGATVLFANCVSPRPMPSHEQLAPHLWRCPPNVVPLAAGDGCYGSTRLEQSLPRGAEGSPFLLVVPEDGKGPSSVEEVTRANTGAITSSLARLRVDAILAVDLGGDSLTGGVDFASDPECGRDRQSAVGAMRAAVRHVDESGALLGVVPLAPLLEPLCRHSAPLAPNRTPNIIKSALERAAAPPEAADEGDGEGSGAARPDLCTINRHGNTAHVPWSWLTVVFCLLSCLKVIQGMLEKRAATARR
ncbi:hypothetical protein EMIHUDRAFT_199930 [Emiliania huxleyi CCMP1516]|uniref:DUF1152 domain-containing protein n=2 Tax=Emiliania huxleyi TaxID=2903 RepID=A0A0D3KUN1_EMIH1|nr:hypothetical protein EMIHUDRAFT_199930 [Emiliania huxleyi CCMP1516]EOD39466.1 hypothetical protein EMIHUDRAFT_199930 [Emiliania huxleyi CCMP1516]|eukprot:XP_005791895.1 hypothetical protein EMIHUDRAFT_199930 [Emiliania huxleyi CCMP1516]